MLNFPQIEEKILKFWQEHDIFKKTLAKKSPKGPFTFYEGPPTANGQPGLHHVLARAFKDLIPRFKTMQGYYVERKAGWDTHGLPVELEVEKKLKISGKPGIEKYGIQKFNQKCQESVWRYKEEWEKLTERIGFWLDLEHPYITYHKDYIETLWWILKKIHERGLLYQGHKVVPQCPRCGTALSSHEVAQGYESITEPSVYLKFKVTKGNQYVKEGDYILSWTTTPWTLPGNVALAVGDFDYVRIQPPTSNSQLPNNLQLPTSNPQTFILAEERLSIIEGDYQIEAEFKGKDLVGVEYEPLFPGAIPSDVENYQNAFKVYSADFVTTKDGTGVVHTAVMYGEDDYQLGDKVGLPKYHTVDESGKFILNPEIKRLKNQKSANVGTQNFASSQQVDALYQMINGQFVKNKEVEQVIVNNLEERGLLFAVKDYTHDYPFCWRCDSPLLYYAKDSWFIKMSALQKELIKENEKINWIPEHIKDGRFGEWLTQIKDWAISRERYWGTPLPIWQCQKCGEIKVIGSYQELYEETQCPLIQKDDFDPHRPFIDEYKLKCQCGGVMSRIPEVADCWFDSGAMPFAQHHYPFENKAKIESKNYYPADYIAEAIDQTRGWFYTLLAVGVLLERGTPYKNVICLGHINDAKGQKMSKRLGNVIDPWIVINQWGTDALRFHLYTINQPGEAKNFDLKNVEEVVKKNFNILFNVLAFYQIYQNKETKDKIPETDNELDKWILSKLNLLIEGITNNLEKYNIFSAGRLITEFINDLSTWYLRRSRDRFKGENQGERNQAVETLGYCLLTLSKLMAPFTPFVAEELYQQVGGEKESVHLEEWPIFDAKNKAETAEFMGKMNIVRKYVEIVLFYRDKAGIKVRQPLAEVEIPDYKLSEYLLTLFREEVNVRKVKVNDKLRVGEVRLDTNISSELKEEGLYRELVRTINQLRKEAKLTIKDKVTINYQTDSELVKKVIKGYMEDLLKNTISQKIIQEKAANYFIEKEVTVNGEKIWLGLR